MNQSAIKTKIFILQVIDWSLLIGIMGGGIYATLYSGNRPLAAVLSILGLAFVNQFGQWSLTKIAIHRQELKQLERTQHH
jgi:Na+/H+ antiporter NhaC